VHKRRQHFPQIFDTPLMSALFCYNLAAILTFLQKECNSGLCTAAVGKRKEYSR
jgi:hypothetical protein